MKKLYICGLSGSGKGLLRLLLDGHSRIINCPFQGFGVGVLQDSFKSFLLATVTSRNLVQRVRLANGPKTHLPVSIDGEDRVIRVSELISGMLTLGTGFQAFMEASISGKIATGTRQDQVQFVDFECDWHAVLRGLTDQLLKMNRLKSQEQLQDILYEQFCSQWKNASPKYDRDKYFLMSAPNRLKTINLLINANVDSKLIIVHREPVARAFASTIHTRNHFRNYGGVTQMDAKELYSDNLFRKYDRDLFSTAFIEEMRVFLKSTKLIGDENRNVHQIYFEDLITNNEKTVEKILEFLHLESEEIVHRPTLNSNELEDQSIWLTDKIHENPHAVLSDRQIRYYQFLMREDTQSLRLIEKLEFHVLLAYHQLRARIRLVVKKVMPTIRG